MNLFKSKFLLGVLVVAAMFVGAVAVKATPAAADCSITMTLRVGSTGLEVSCLQSSLNAGLVADGKFGPKTQAAVKAWQTAKGLVADGVFGPKSRAVWMGSVSTGSWPAGCTSASGYSSTTGQSCSGSSGSLPAGCVPGAAYSSTTGQACSSTSVGSGTNGYLSDFASDSTNRVSTVYESETDKVVAGIRATARLADQTVERVRVTFENKNGASSANLARYITGASLWYGTTKIATIAVNDADRNTSTDVYTFNFSGLNAKVMRDQIGRFYVSVNANGSIDTNDTTAQWDVDFTDGGVLYSSPDGSSDTVMIGATHPTVTGLGFNKFSSNGVKATVGLSNTNPNASIIAVQDTASATNGVDLLKFTVKASNSDLTLRKIPIQIAKSGSAKNVADIINTVKLYRDGNLVDSVDGSASFVLSGGGIDVDTGDTTIATTAGFLFSNLSDPQNKITSGSTATFTVTVDLKGQDGGTNYADGETLTASLTNLDVVSGTLTGSTDLDFSVQDVNGDQLSRNSSFRVGSAVGNIMTLFVNGINVTQGAASVSKISDNAGIVTSVTYDIPLTVTAFGQTLYVGQAAELAAAASGTDVTAKAFSFSLQDSAAPAVDIVANPAAITVTSTLSSSDALIENDGFRLDSGSAKHFTMQVIISCDAASCAGATTANYRVNTLTVRSQDDSLLPAPTNQTLVPAQSYQTGYQKIK